MSKHKMLQISTINKMAFDKKRWRVFADWLKAQREEANLSQDGLANLVGVDRQTIYRLENALSGTKRETILRIAEALNASEREALGKAGFAVIGEDDDELVADGLFEGYYDLPEELRPLARKQIAAIIRSLKDEEITTNNKEFALSPEKKTSMKREHRSSSFSERNKEELLLSEDEPGYLMRVLPKDEDADDIDKPKVQGIKFKPRTENRKPD